MIKRVAFICVENSCRSQMAEAIANKLYAKSDCEFVSAGTVPANVVDPKALEVLREIGIYWDGYPKEIDKVFNIPFDIVVTMGCEVSCPIISGAKTIQWDIPDPKGKGVDEYRKVLRIIMEKVIELLNKECREVSDEEKNSSHR